jgi:hypothetical protein
MPDIGIIIVVASGATASAAEDFGTAHTKEPITLSKTLTTLHRSHRETAVVGIAAAGRHRADSIILSAFSQATAGAGNDTHSEESNDKSKPLHLK